MAGKKGRSGGHNRKTKDAKVLAGTFEKRRSAERPAPVVREAPARPDYLTGRAVELWEFYVDRLGPANRNVLTAEDGDSLATLCQAFARYEEAERDITANGTVLIFETPKTYRGEVILHEGSPVMESKAMANPAVRVALELQRNLRGWVSYFGLTPADRDRINALPDGTEEEGLTRRNRG